MDLGHHIFKQTQIREVSGLQNLTHTHSGTQTTSDASAVAQKEIHLLQTHFHPTA